MSNGKYHYRLSKFLCTRCGHNPIRETGFYLCDLCTDKERKRQSEGAKARRLRKKKNGICAQCSKKSIEGLSRCQMCLISSRLSTKKFRENIKINNKDRYEKEKAKKRITEKERGKIWRVKLKKEIIEQYGGKCVCCGESEILFLTIDHVNNDGYLLRKIETTQIYSFLKKNNFPKDSYQLLCFNCNLGKHYNGGRCPHLKKI